jgi:hypothetical protein
MTAEIIDFNIIALEALSRKALESGNPFESYAMAHLIDGYREGLWKINWQRGEPIFEAALSAEEIRDRYGDALLD